MSVAITQEEALRYGLIPGRHVHLQPGPQERLTASQANIRITGGSAFGGKTFSILLDPTRYISIKGFTAVIFRRLSPDIHAPGGLWPESLELYPFMGAQSRESSLDHTWASGARIKFSHLQYEQDKLNWKGAQICSLGFDQLEEFTEGQFWYLFSRNRSKCGVKPYTIATCNPDPDSWLATFLAWWIDQGTGYAIPERSGVLRWFIRLGDEIHWEGSKQEARAWAIAQGVHESEALPTSVTFIPSKIYDNPKGMESDPAYLAKLLALPYVDRMRLLGDRTLGGNWKIRPSAGKFFHRDWFKLVDAVPAGDATTKRGRYWDKAGTEGAGAYTAGVKITCLGQGNRRQFYIEDVRHGQWGALQREQEILKAARADNATKATECPIWGEQEPGSGGKESAENTVRMLAGYVCDFKPATGDKFERAKPLAAQAEAGNVFVVRGAWNESFLNELHNADPNVGKQFRDQMDAAAGCFNRLAMAGYGFGIA